VEEVRSSGARFVIATARPLIEAVRIARSLALTDPIICQNGAVIAYSPYFRSILDRYLIPYPTLVALVDNVRATCPEATLAIDYPLARITDPNWPTPNGTPYGQATLWPLAAQELPHRRRAACLMMRNAQIDAQLFQERYAVTVTSSESGLVEISQKGVDKAKALRRICRKLDIAPEFVVAFGDMLNDIRMLNVSGLGVAMSNAAEPVRAMADYIAPSNEHDGVAEVLKQLLFDGKIGERRPLRSLC
jgi:HAD superfamily hydrolase (TIGR01484 family)